MTTPPLPTPQKKADPRPKLLPNKRNEHLKLAAAACDRISTVVLGAAVLAPIFQHQDVAIGRSALWAAGASLLHGAAQFVLSFLEEET